MHQDYLFLVRSMGGESPHTSSLLAEVSDGEKGERQRPLLAGNHTSHS